MHSRSSYLTLLTTKNFHTCLLFDQTCHYQCFRINSASEKNAPNFLNSQDSQINKKYLRSCPAVSTNSPMLSTNTAKNASITVSINIAGTQRKNQLTIRGKTKPQSVNS